MMKMNDKGDRKAPAYDMLKKDPMLGCASAEELYAWNVETIGPEFFDRFGTPTEAQKQLERATYLVRYSATNCPSELTALLTELYERGKEWTCPEYSVKHERIEFGYKDQVYKIRAGTLDLDTGTFEEHAPEILRELQAFGCDYGVYDGYLD